MTPAERKRIFMLEQRLNRIEDILQGLGIEVSSAISRIMLQQLPNGTCLECNTSFIPGSICPNEDCPHGLNYNG